MKNVRKCWKKLLDNSEKMSDNCEKFRKWWKNVARYCFKCLILSNQHSEILKIWTEMTENRSVSLVFVATQIKKKVDVRLNVGLNV